MNYDLPNMVIAFNNINFGCINHNHEDPIVIEAGIASAIVPKYSLTKGVQIIPGNLVEFSLQKSQEVP